MEVPFKQKPSHSRPLHNPNKPLPPPKDEVNADTYCPHGERPIKMAILEAYEDDRDMLLQMAGSSYNYGREK